MSLNVVTLESVPRPARRLHIISRHVERPEHMEPAESKKQPWTGASLQLKVSGTQAVLARPGQKGVGFSMQCTGVRESGTGLQWGDVRVSAPLLLSSNDCRD